MNTSIANKAMLRFAKEYAQKNWLLEGWVRPDDFWANKVEKFLHPEKPQVIEVSLVAPVFDEDREKGDYWQIPRVKIDSYWGHPRLNVVDKERNFCCISYDRETNKFKEGQFWGEHGLELAQRVKAKIELYIQMMKDGYDMQIEQQKQ